MKTRLAFILVLGLVVATAALAGHPIQHSMIGSITLEPGSMDTVMFGFSAEMVRGRAAAACSVRVVTLPEARLFPAKIDTSHWLQVNAGEPFYLFQPAEGIIVGGGGSGLLPFIVEGP